jgi:hypothetical protein
MLGATLPIDLSSTDVGTPAAMVWPLAVALAFGSQACGDGGPGAAATYEVRDSAGVEIVTNLDPAMAGAGDAWAVSETPAATMEPPEAGGEYTLYQVSQLAFMGGDRIAVGVGGTNEILVLTVDGNLEASMGGTGQGPGQFKSLASIGVLPGDSVVGFGFASRQAQIFGPGGELARTFTPEPERDPLSYDELLTTDSGQFYLLRHAQVQPGVEPGTHRISAPSFRLDSEGRLVAELGPFPGRMITSGSFFGILLFSPELVGAGLGEGIVVGVGDREELQVLAPDGHLSRIIRWPRKDRTLDAEQVEGIILRANAESPEPAPQPVIDQFLKLPFPEEYPPYGHLLTSDSGEIWVGEYWVGDLILPEAPPPPREWKVFDSSGIWLTSVTTPEGFELEDVRGDELLGVYRNELGVESIRIYRLARGGSQ